MRGFQSCCPTAVIVLSKNCSTELVQPLTQVMVPAWPFLLCDRISLMPTHLANQTALVRGIFLFKHCSSSNLPVTPWGIVRLSLRKLTVGFARSWSQVSRVESLKVSRGGGLKLFDAVMRPDACLFSNTAINKEDKAFSPFRLFLRLRSQIGCLAVLVSLLVSVLLEKPVLTMFSLR